jgi:hypothetical protein
MIAKRPDTKKRKVFPGEKRRKYAMTPFRAMQQTSIEA